MNEPIACPYCGSGPFQLLGDEGGALHVVKCLHCRCHFSVAFLQDADAVKRWIAHDRGGPDGAALAAKTGRD